MSFKNQLNAGYKFLKRKTR